METINMLTEYAVRQAVELLAIDSPTSYTQNAAEYLMAEYRRLGFEPFQTNKGGVQVCLNPQLAGENGTLRVATTVESKPFDYLKDGQPYGFDVEFIFRFAKKYIA